MFFTFHIPAAGTLRHIRGRKGFWSAEQMATSPVTIRNLEHNMEISTQSKLKSVESNRLRIPRPKKPRKRHITCLEVRVCEKVVLRSVWVT